MLATHLAVLLLWCSGLCFTLEVESSMVSSISDTPGYKDIQLLASSTDFLKGCYINKLKMKKISYGCKKCTCKDNAFECITDSYSCDAGGGTCNGDKDSWIQGNKNCTCINGSVSCSSLIVKDEPETYENQDTSIGAGHLPLKVTYNHNANAIFVLQWNNPNIKAQKYSFHMSAKEPTDREFPYIKFLRKGKGASFQQDGDNYQKVCYRGFVAVVMEQELSRTYVIGESTEIGVPAMPCPDEIYHLFLLAHIFDRCPEWNDSETCNVANDICASDSDCPEEQVCCIISNCGRGCTKPSHYGIEKTISSPLKILDLRDGTP